MRPGADVEVLWCWIVLCVEPKIIRKEHGDVLLNGIVTVSDCIGCYIRGRDKGICELCHRMRTHLPAHFIRVSDLHSPKIQILASTRFGCNFSSFDSMNGNMFWDFLTSEQWNGEMTHY